MTEAAIYSRSPGEIDVRRSFVGLKGTIIASGLMLSVLLAAPGRTVTSKYLNDLLIFLDGAHRIALGQVPNVDFHTSLGPLAFYIPAAGYALSGSLGAAMPVGMALVVLLMTVLAAVIIPSRMRWSLGLPTALYLLLVVAVPANPGEAISEITFAMFYNRIGWAALGLLFVLYLPRQARMSGNDAVDATCTAALVLLMLYTKVTYGLVGLGFLLLMLTDRRQVRWVGLAFAITLGAVLAIEAVWQGGAEHIADLRLASAVSGSVPTIQRLVDVIASNLADIAVYGLFAVLLLWLARSIRDFLFLGFCLGSGILIIEQNFQIVGILTLSAGAAVASEQLLRQPLAFERLRLAAGLPLLMAILILPASVANLANLGLHAGLAMSGRGEQVPLPQFEGIRLVRTFGPGSYERFSRYNETIADGRMALGGLDPRAERVAVMDFVNPFSAGLSLQPPKGDYPWYHWGRTLDAVHFPPADETLADADIVMQPKLPIERYTGEGMPRIYEGYLRENFRQVADTRYWTVYRRQQ